MNEKTHQMVIKLFETLDLCRYTHGAIYGECRTISQLRFTHAECRHWAAKKLTICTIRARNASLSSDIT